MSNVSAEKPYWKKLLLAVCALLAAALSFLAWQHFYPVTSAADWTTRVYLDDFAMPSAMARDGGGVLYITHELTKQRGSLVRQLPDGSLQEVMTGLDKPDGLASFRGGIVISQEGGEYPVLWQHDGRVDTLFVARNIEGVDADAEHVYAVEDQKGDGRLLRYAPADGRVTVLRGGLVEAEGVAACPDGRLFYSEKKHGWVKEYHPAAKDDPVVVDGLNAPGFIMCSREGLWIAEDATHGAKLFLLDASGRLQEILAHLRSAQTIFPLAPGRLLVAEQGRNRILEITRSASTPR